MGEVIQEIDICLELMQPLQFCRRRTRGQICGDKMIRSGIEDHLWTCSTPRLLPELPESLYERLRQPDRSEMIALAKGSPQRNAPGLLYMSTSHESGIDFVKCLSVTASGVGVSEEIGSRLVVTVAEPKSVNRVRTIRSQALPPPQLRLLRSLQQKPPVQLTAGFGPVTA